MSRTWILVPLAAAVVGVILLVAAAVRIIRRERAAEGWDGLDRTDEAWPPP